MREKGGIAVYVRDNLSVLDVYRSNLFEIICVTLALPTGHQMLVCGVYHPPKYNYQEYELMNHLVNLFDNALDKSPNSVIVWGGDLNRPDIMQLQRLTGLNVLVDFPTRGDAFLDNYLTNRLDLFGKAFPFRMQIKTDHLGFIVPAGKKLKPLRRKVQFRDCREHRKSALYKALLIENWDSVLESENVETAVNILERKILFNMGKCMPIRHVSLSTRDPPWMTPLVKYMLRCKSRIPASRADRHRELSKRISEVISENRRLLIDAKIGSREWWKNIDTLSQRPSDVNCSTRQSDDL